MGMEREPQGRCKDVAGAGEPRVYLTLSGQVDSTPKSVGRLMAAAWIRRIVFNATIDPHVEFATGVAYRLAKSRAARLDRDEPPEPTSSDTFLPMPRPIELHEVLTRLREEHDELRRWPATMLRLAIDEACRARKRHVQDCIKAKAEGRKPPRLHYRSASDDIDVSTENFRILRCGDGPAVTEPKRRKKSQAAVRKRRKDAEIEAKDLDWADRRRAAGMTEPRVLAGLREREERRERSRKANAGRVRETPSECEGRNKPLPRRDSPSATIGQSRIRIEVQGLGRSRVRLSRPIPEGAEVVRVHYVKEAGPTNRVEVRLVMTVPWVKPTYDELETGSAIHAVIRELPAGASPLDAVTAVEAAGIKVRGDDWNVSAPSADHTGKTTKRVSVSKAEMVKTRDLQRHLSHKDRLLLNPKGEAETKPVETEAEQPKPKARRRPQKRSHTALRVKAQLQRMARKLRNRATTRACQDAKLLAGDVVLVASDPQRMAKPLLAKGGPAERRAKAAAGIPATVLASPPRGYQLNPEQQRAQRRNMHMARPGYRVRRLALLCGTAGVIHATPGHEGTTRTCPKCEAVEAKDLSQRIHDCPRCGLRMPRDRASALVTLGRALLEFRDGPDPGGRVAERRANAAETAQKAILLRKRRVEAGRKTGRQNMARAQARSHKAGAIPAGGAAAPSLQGDVPLCLGRPGRNIGGTSEAVRLRISD